MNNYARVAKSVERYTNLKYLSKILHKLFYKNYRTTKKRSCELPNSTKIKNIHKFSEILPKFRKFYQKNMCKLQPLQQIKNFTQLPKILHEPGSRGSPLFSTLHYRTSHISLLNVYMFIVRVNFSIVPHFLCF